MKAMSALRNVPCMAKTFLSNPQMVLVRPSLTRFMCSYMNKFRVRTVGKNMIVHSHLPPLNSKAYSRFIDEHLISGTSGPSHAQIAITDRCPQNCRYCYNKDREGRPMETETILRVVRELKEMGMVWLGLTGGEPLLNKEIVAIVKSVSAQCAVKLFTTGCTLTRELAGDLRNAGLFSVSVSLDHWDAGIHDAARNYNGAFREALKAIDTFKRAGGIDVGVSAVLTPGMIRSGDTEKFVRFLEGLGIDEAWLSEAKPTVEAFWDDRYVITEDDRLKLVKFQNEYNANGGMTINYLGHFEGRECFGCNAGHKMVYVDAFGEVSPCVFTPMSFGNVRNMDMDEILAGMKSYFPSDSRCFINRNYRLFQKFSGGRKVIAPEDSRRFMEMVNFEERSAFFRLYYGDRRPERRGGKSRETGGGRGMRYYRPLSLAMAVCFAIAGVVFVAMPDGVIRFFNSLSPAFSLPPSPLTGHSFYLVLAAAYMYVVAALAFMMYLRPRERYFPLLLINAKLASSFMSVIFFISHARYLVYVANFVVDAAIGMLVFLIYVEMTKAGKWASS